MNPSLFSPGYGQIAPHPKKKTVKKKDNFKTSIYELNSLNILQMAKLREDGYQLKAGSIRFVLIQ